VVKLLNLWFKQPPATSHRPLHREVVMDVAEADAAPEAPVEVLIRTATTAVTAVVGVDNE